MNMVAGGERIAIETNNSAKPVIQYDLKGNCIAKYNSQLEAAASVGLLDSTAISKCCITKSGSAKGFIWRFEGDLLDLNLDSIHSVPICQYDFKGNLIATYNSIKEAADATESKWQSIQRVCSGQRKSTNNYKWKYAD